MADYKRLVSYIYAYPGGVRDKNVGFAKAEVRNGQFKLTVSVKGVYTDTPELFGVYVMVDGKKHQPGGFTLLKTGTVMVNQGIGLYLCKKAADQLGIDIEVESEPYHGTKVLLTIRQHHTRHE